MSKRFLNYLLGAIIFVVIAGIIAYFVFPNFQAWVEIWLARPDGLAASATTIAALATLFAVIVGLRGIQIGRDLAKEAHTQAEEAIKENREQFLEAQCNASRPLLVPITSEPGGQYEQEEPVSINWGGTQMFVTIQNVGTGIATNIWITLMPPAPLPDSSYQYVCRLGSPVSPSHDPFKIYLQQGSSFDEHDSIGGHSLCVPPDQADRSIARLCMTYQDIFSRKHVSIFDISDRGVWVNVAFLTGAEHDLKEIDAAKENKPVAVEAEVQ